MSGHERGKIEAVVFDFDGTLAELHLDFGEMKQRLGALAGEYLPSPLPLPAVPALEWLEVLQAEIRGAREGSEIGFRRRAEQLITDMEMEAARRGALFPFTRSVLEALRGRSIKVAIITRNCGRAVRHVFPDMDRYCAGFLAREDVPRVKPDPDHLLRALRKILAAPQAALMVGDHPIDIKTGLGAGVLTAGVSSGSATREDLSRTGARWTAGNCEELMRMLDEQKWI